LIETQHQPNQETQIEPKTFVTLKNSTISSPNTTSTPLLPSKASNTKSLNEYKSKDDLEFYLKLELVKIFLKWTKQFTPSQIGTHEPTSQPHLFLKFNSTTIFKTCPAKKSSKNLPHPLILKNLLKSRLWNPLKNPPNFQNDFF